ncbi:small integral membrane protein 12 isoform 1-T1 [Hipposideros larvatus]
MTFYFLHVKKINKNQVVTSQGNLLTTRGRCGYLSAEGAPLRTPSLFRSFDWSSANPCAPREQEAGGRGPEPGPAGRWERRRRGCPRASGGRGLTERRSAGSGSDVMWPVLWTVVRTYAPYVTFPVAFVVGAVGYHLEWFIRGKAPQPVEEEKSISERREDRKLDELLGKDHTQVVSLKDKLEFAPKAVLNRNRPEKN